MGWTARICFVALGVLVAGASAGQPAPRAVVDRALDAAMVPGMLEVQELGLRDRLKTDPRFQQVAPEDRPRLETAILDATDSKRLYAEIADAIARRFDAPTLEVYIAAYSTPVARKVNALALEASRPESVEARKKYIEGLQTKLPPEARVRLVVRLDELTGASEAMAESMVGMVARFSRAEPGTARYEELAAKVRENARDNALVLLLFGFNGATDAELQAFVELHETRAVREVATALTKAVFAAMETTVDRAIENVVTMQRGTGTPRLAPPSAK